MHDITELPAWERLFKKIVWTQLRYIEGKRILDFEATNALLEGGRTVRLLSSGLSDIMRIMIS